MTSFLTHMPIVFILGAIVASIVKVDAFRERIPVPAEARSGQEGR